VAGTCLSTVIAGRDPAIHEEAQHVMMLVSFSKRRLIMDARVKFTPGSAEGRTRLPAHDAEIWAKAA
jgi:hypothetical protein